MDKYIGSKKVCEMFDISPNTFRAWCNNGNLPAVKVGKNWLVNESKLKKMLEGGMNNG